MAKNVTEIIFAINDKKHATPHVYCRKIRFAVEKTFGKRKNNSKKYISVSAVSKKKSLSATTCCTDAEASERLKIVRMVQLQVETKGYTFSHFKTRLCHVEGTHFSGSLYVR